MTDSAATNDAVWKSEAHVAAWAATAAERERGREAARRLVAELLPFDEGDAFLFVDLGAGTGAAARAVLDAYPASSAILAEYSPQMVEEGTRSLSAYDGRFRYVDVDLARGTWPEALAGPLEAVVSSLCVHHLPDHRKAELFAEVIERLAPGGWYVNYDPVAPEEPAVEEAWRRVSARRDPDAARRSAQRSAEEHERWENHVRHIAPLSSQLDWMRAAGFEAVDVYAKELDHAIFAGRRPVR